MNPTIARIAGLRCPTVAAVQGAALGFGLGLALACDLLVVGEGAKIGSPFAAIGAVLDSGSHHFLCSRIGPARTLELVYTGRFLSGAEAVEWGIANSVHPDDELLGAARTLVATIAAGPTTTFLLSKDIVRPDRRRGPFARRGAGRRGGRPGRRRPHPRLRRRHHRLPGKAQAHLHRPLVPPPAIRRRIRQ